MNLITAYVIITRVTQHMETMLLMDPKKEKVKWWLNDSVYWYNRYQGLLEKTFKQYDANDFLRLGRKQYDDAVILQPSHLSAHFMRELNRKKEREFNNRMSFGSFR